MGGVTFLKNVTPPMGHLLLLSIVALFILFSWYIYKVTGGHVFFHCAGYTCLQIQAIDNKENAKYSFLFPQVKTVKIFFSVSA